MRKIGVLQAMAFPGQPSGGLAQPDLIGGQHTPIPDHAKRGKSENVFHFRSEEPFGLTVYSPCSAILLRIRAELCRVRALAMRDWLGVAIHGHSPGRREWVRKKSRTIERESNSVDPDGPSNDLPPTLLPSP